MQNKWTHRLALGLAASAMFVAAGGPSYAASKINGKNIKSKSITGSKLKSNTLSGTQIKESNLGTVPKATAADSATTATNAGNADTTDGVSQEAFTIARVGTDTACDNASSVAFSDCVGVSITLPRSAKVKVDVFTQWHSDGGVGARTAQCRIEQNGVTIGSTVNPGSLSDDTDGTNTRSLALGTVSGVLAAGSYTFNVACQADAGDDFDLSDIRTTAVMVGTA